MSKKNIIKGREDGSILVVVLVMLVLLTGLGIAASTNTETELKIAGNDKFHKIAFYAADGGTEAGIELLEQNIDARGFSVGTIGTATINDMEFYANEESTTSSDNIPSDTNRDITIPDIGNCDVYLKIYGNTELSTGAALQIAAGYEGKGKGVAGGGAYVIYNIRSFSVGASNNQARVGIRWRHMI